MESTSPAARIYPEESARRLLNDATGSRPEYANERVNAAQALLNQFAELAKEYNFRVRFEDNDALRILGTPEKTYLLVRKNPGWLYIAQASGKDTPIELNYNHTTQTFEGTEIDPDIAPEPGKLRPRISPLVVLARTLLSLTNEDD
ncbi:hypothetical protein [Corallococcus exiguus]|uniref:hypothetical protein n=1 Tax=Corallococcus exiguus TaxID=83462 RepID=UPI0014944F0B|nr:hypothetical protein [Corallococcus exiguus]NPD27449.1 hypothetical protein [Corallococcus exiguus]